MNFKDKIPNIEFCSPNSSWPNQMYAKGPDVFFRLHDTWYKSFKEQQDFSRMKEIGSLKRDY